MDYSSYTQTSKKDYVLLSQNRLILLASLFLLCFSLIGIRLIHLTLMRDYKEPNLVSAPITKKAPTERGNIFDRNGNLLATNLKTASLYSNPTEIIDVEEAVTKITSVIPSLSKEVLQQKLNSKKQFSWIKRNLTPKEHADVHHLGIPGVYFQYEEKRLYPLGPLFSHVIGYTNIDNHGISGIEKYFDKNLRSESQDIKLSLDLRVQHIVRNTLLQAKEKFKAIGAVGIMLDAKNFEVVSMVSLPDFDPNKLKTSKADDRFHRATLGIYELGSVFKIFTSAIAAETGTMTMKDGYDTRKPIVSAGYRIRDFHPKKKWLSYPEIFMYSSNIGAAYMAQKFGTEAQKMYLDSFGLLKPLSLEVPEIGKPILPNRWREINTLTISYGHGIAVSPMQLTAAVASVVNGGKYISPTLISRKKNTPLEFKQVLSSETSNTIKYLMKTVVDKGTGRPAAVLGYDVGGKTGTAEKPKGGKYSKKLQISSFMAAFPIHNPQYVLFVFLDEPKGTKETHGYATASWVAAPMVREIIEQSAPLLGVKKSRNQYDIENSNEMNKGFLRANF